MLLVGLALAWLAAPAGVAAEETSLAALVPHTAGLTIELADLAPAADRFLDGPLGRRWKAYGPLDRWWRQNQDQATRMVADVGRYLQVSPEAVWRDVLGHRALLAVWPPRVEGTAAPVDKPRPPASALLLLRSQNAATLNQLVDGFCAAQTRFEQVQWQRLRHGDIEYRQGQGANQGPDLYVAVAGNVAVVSDTAGVLQDALDLLQGRQGKQRSLAGQAGYQQALAALPGEVNLRLFVQPKVWDAALAADAAAATGQERVEKERFLALWREAQGLCVVAQWGTKVSLQALAQFDSSGWPEAARTVWQAAQGPAQFAARIPADSMVAFAARLDLPAVLQVLQRASGEERPAAWAWTRAVFSVLGSEWGGYHRWNPAHAAEAVPADWVLAAALREKWEGGSGGATPSEFLQEALPGLLQLLAANQPELQVRSAATPDARHGVWLLERPGRLGALDRVAIAVAEGHLWCGSSLATMERALAEEPAALANDSAWNSLLPGQLSAPSGFLYVNAARSRDYIETHLESFAAAVAAARGIDADQPRRGLGQLQQFLELFDRALLATRFERDSARLSVTIEADEAR